MSENCCGSSKHRNGSCELPLATSQWRPRAANLCPSCGKAGKTVPGQTVKAMLAVSLRTVRADVTYLFCRTATCAVVYFSPDDTQTLTTAQVRERVFQKELDADDVFVCHCFRHTVGDIRAASAPQRAAMLDDIQTGIESGQCACDLRNPQGACCLGNVRAVIKHVERFAAANALAH